MDIGVSKKDRTKDVHLNLTNMPDRVYIDEKLWICTAYGEIQVAVVDGPIYKLIDGELVKHDLDCEK